MTPERLKQLKRLQYLIDETRRKLRDLSGLIAQLANDDSAEAERAIVFLLGIKRDFCRRLVSLRKGRQILAASM